MTLNGDDIPSREVAPPAPLVESDYDLKLELERLRQLDEEARRRRRTKGMEFYSPNPMQLRAHQSDARKICYVGGNRAGKSTFGALELSFHLTKKYPDWFSKKRRFKGPIRAMVSATEFPIVQRVIEPKIFQYLPRDYFTYKRTAQGYLTRIMCEDGSTVDVLTGEMADEAYESADWDFAWMDEPQQRRKYEAILRGLVDRNGLMVFTFTPLAEPWMKDELVDKADGRSIACFTVDIRDNLKTVQGDPILNEQAVKEFEDSLPEDVRDTRVHGKFFHLRGAVYQEFGEAHQTEFIYEYPNPVICVLDPHDRLPHHLIWAYVDRTDDVFIDYEYVKHVELPELAKTILQIEQKRGYKVRKRLIDPNFGRKPSRVGTNLTVIQELQRHGAAFYESNDNIELGHMLVREALHYNRLKPVTATNKPKLFFSKERTPLTIRSVRNHQFEDWEGKHKGDRDPKERPKDKDDHGADDVRYLMASRPTYERLISQEAPELEGAPY